ncbi:MAG: CDP-diacylglycerol--glycerol-3-phosphate 3-phosphatidyltransferase [Oscillospiraceae bacterium]|nr:CDP-diacylglycerol--glycerol-3-phosphate 3-phosphatidyltransferase [Oscillospiraceae bacterium]
MTTANKITLVRIVLIPVFLILAYLGHTWWALGVYIVACISDTVDGYIARRYKQVTDFGKFIDPLADKMLVLAAMIYFVEIGVMPGWAVAVVLFREFAVSGLRMIAVEQHRVIAAAWSGKIKTAVTMVGLGALLVFGDVTVLRWLVVILIVATTLYSGVEYFVKNLDVFKDVK